MSSMGRSTLPRSRMIAGRVAQVHAHQRVGLLVVPLAAELGDQLVLGGDPVRLGVDDGAVHVPQDGGRAGHLRARGQRAGLPARLRGWCAGATQSPGLVVHVGQRVGRQAEPAVDDGDARRRCAARR